MLLELIFVLGVMFSAVWLLWGSLFIINKVPVGVDFWKNCFLPHMHTTLNFCGFLRHSMLGEKLSSSALSGDFALWVLEFPYMF